MKTTKFIRIVLLGVLVCPLSAQQRGITISGKVTDTNKDALEGVAVVIKNATDSSYVTDNITDTCGMYTFSNIKAQTYLLEYSMLGYKKQIASVLLSKNQALDSVTLEEDVQQLSGVTVTGMRTFIKMKPGTTSFDMEAMVVGSQGNVLDALRSLPGIMVNEDGTVVRKAIEEDRQSVSKAREDWQNATGKEASDWTFKRFLSALAQDISE